MSADGLSMQHETEVWELHRSRHTAILRSTQPEWQPSSGGLLTQRAGAPESMPDWYDADTVESRRRMDVRGTKV
jgi:hypothetical protein